MKILLLTMNKGDATSHYRAAGVVRDLVRRGYSIDMFDWPEILLTWPVLARYDLVWMQRPGPPNYGQAINAMNYCKQMALPVVLDYDDNLFNVPVTHENAHGFAEFRESLILLLQGATATMVSTRAIHQDYSQFSPNVHIVPNAVPDDMLRPFTSERSDILLYRGMRNHIPDIYAYQQHFQQLIDDGYKVKFIGVNPFFLRKYIFLQGRDLYKYFDYFRAMRVRALLFPMADTRFNHSRSNIAWIEATMAGTVCIAPDWEEWQCPGIIRHAPKDFYATASALMKGEIDVEAHYRASYEYIRENLVVSKVNALRAQVFEMAAQTFKS